MIVLHVARARTDSINIRGSLGKTRAALWITDATFLYFSGCNAHTPFTLFPFRSLSLSFFFFPSLFIYLSFSFNSCPTSGRVLLSFHGFPLPSSSCFPPSLARTSFLFRSNKLSFLFSSSPLLSIYLHLRFPAL